MVDQKKENALKEVEHETQIIGHITDDSFCMHTNGL